MLELRNITKTYSGEGFHVNALDEVSIAFRENEFAAILGPSGSGKTTLLNIIGGLDRYTSGDLLINGRSTKQFSSRDWDTYRNHSIGFVFQSYNLIPHQSVLANVELALTLSGVRRKERRQRAKEALEKVGLGDQLSKRPAQMSGGQMQRVAIARALVNNPDILLADEPTGALDSVTSVQIMDLLKEIAKDRLVIMVTHNPELAAKYATRLIRVRDGKVLEDSDPFSGKETAVKAAGGKRTSMSFLTAVSLSLNNLMTKKTRTLLTSFAGSIGIIGIALIMSLSNGIQSYITQLQEETLSAYPITIEAESIDISQMMTTMMGSRHEEAEHGTDRVYASSVLYDMLDAMSSSNIQTNDLKSFKTYLESEGNGISPYLSAVQYSYNFRKSIYTRDADGNIVKSDVTELMNKMMRFMYGAENLDLSTSAYSKAYMQNFEVWKEMLPGEDGAPVNSMLSDQYEVLYGHWPTAYNEIVLVVDENNEVSDLCLYALGLESSSEMTASLEASMKGEELEDTVRSWSYEEICAQPFRLVLASDEYSYDSVTGKYTNLTATDTGLSLLYDNGLDLKVTAVVRPGANASSAMRSGSIGYTAALTDYMLSRTSESKLLKEQLDNPETDVLTGLPFPTDRTLSLQEQAAFLKDYFASMSVMEKASAYTRIMSTPSQDYLTQAVNQTMAQMTRAQMEEQMVAAYTAETGMDEASVKEYLAKMSDDEFNGYARQNLTSLLQKQYAQQVSQQLAAMTTDQLAGAMDKMLAEADEAAVKTMYELFSADAYSTSTYQKNLEALGYADASTPSSVMLYSSTFADKDAIADAIAAYNETVEDISRITYTDYVAMLISGVTSFISAVSYVLIAFVAISLFVSSIMIGIITYISVLERTKEIGILRAIGASRRDVSRVFNAETLLVGLCSGIMGILITFLLCIPMNMIIHSLTDISDINASLPPVAAVVLVGISVFLTVFAGLIPAVLAARKDPVEALRSE